jgi:gamma-glutamyltranspeptidase
LRADVSKINLIPFASRPEIEGAFGVVVSTHWIEIAVAMALLEKGANAFDAATTTAFTVRRVGDRRASACSTRRTHVF